MKTLIHSTLLCVPLLLAGPARSAAPDAAAVHLKDHGLRAGALEEVLPQNALLHVQINRVQLVLENLEDFIVATVPEKLAPPQFQQLLATEHPVLTALGMQFLQAPLTAQTVADRLGLDSNGSISLTLYPGLPTRSFLISLPVADLAAFDGFLHQVLGGTTWEAGSVGGKEFVRIQLDHPQLKQLVVAASDRRVYLSGDESLLMLLYPGNNFPRLTEDAFMAQVFRTNAQNEVWAALNPRLLKPILPQIEFFEYVPLNLLFSKRAEWLAQIPPQQKAMIEQRLRIQYGIESLDQLADYAECFITATYEELFDAVLSGLKSFNGIAVGKNFERGFPQASLYLYCDSIDPSQGMRAIPMAEVRAALARLPGNHHHISVSGRQPNVEPPARFVSWLNRLQKSLEAKHLKTGLVEAMAKVNQEAILPQPVATRVPWTLRTRERVNPLPPMAGYDSLQAYGQDLVSLLANPPTRTVTVVPRTPGILRDTLDQEMEALRHNRQLTEETFFPGRSRTRWIDRTYRLGSEELDRGVNRLTWETAFVTRGGWFGFNQHELINRRFYFTREVGDYSVFHQASRNADWISGLELNRSGRISKGLAKLLDRVPEGTTQLCAHRFLSDLPRATSWIEGFEGLVRRELDGYLARAREIGAEVADAEVLKERLAQLKFPPLVYSLNRDPESGEFYCLLPGGVVYPRPAVTPLATVLFKEFNDSAEDLGGLLAYQRVTQGMCEASLVVSTEAVSRLIKTVGNALCDQYLGNPEGMQGVLQKVMTPRDADPARLEQILMRNPMWEALPLPGQKPQAWPQQSKVESAPRHPIAERASDTPENLIDLSGYYNASPDDSWHAGGLENNTLDRLPRGVREMAGAHFDVRGIVQLSGTDAEAQLSVKFPDAVTGIEINRRCEQLHFLHGTGWQAPEGTVVAAYVIHYADGETREFPILYGTHVRDWWTQPDFGPAPASTVAWEGENAATEASAVELKLYKTTWKNPRPDQRIASLDYVSKRSPSAPFLIAITTESIAHGP